LIGVLSESYIGMKVIHVVIGGDIAGGQVICGRIVRALKQRGDDVAVVSPTEGDFTLRLRSEGIAVTIMPFGRSYHLQRAWRFAKFLKAEKADLVHTHAHL